jgi:predicted nuclease of predicted toxin-antitoxin system
VKLKLDKHFGRSTVKLFHESGHDVATVRSQELQGATDEVLIEACQREQRCLVTLDSDFGNPLIFKPWEYPGIAVLRLPSKPSHEDLGLQDTNSGSRAGSDCRKTLDGPAGTGARVPT